MDKCKIIHSNVKIGDGAIIGAFTLLGSSQKKSITIIGNNAMIRSHTVIYEGNKIGDNFQTGHGVLIRNSNIIGNNVSIGSHTIIEHNVKIGNNVRIHSNSFIPEFTLIEDNVWIGPAVVFTNARYPLSKDVKKNLRGPIIKKSAKIGGNATILPGLIIGEGSLIGAGAVVTKNVKPFEVVVGNPAQVINTVRNLPYV